jgi:hypothetical protein
VLIEVLPPLGKYKYDTWRILPVKCYIDNFVRLRSYIRNINNQSDHPNFVPKLRWYPLLVSPIIKDVKLN